MSDFNNINNSPVIEPFLELAASQDVAPKHESEPDNPETTGSLPQTPVDAQPLSEQKYSPDYYQGHHVHGLEHEGAAALHGGGGGDSSSPPPFPLMALHIPMRSGPDEMLAAVPEMHHQEHHQEHHVHLQHQHQHQPQYLWPAGHHYHQHQHQHQHQHHETDSFAYGDSTSPSSPAVSWASSLGNLPDHLAHADDPWHGLSPTSPPELASPDADSLAASPEWHYEHVAASPLDDFVGMTAHAPRSPAPPPSDCLPSMDTSYMPPEHQSHHHFFGCVAATAGPAPEHVYLNEQGRSALASASLRAQMVNQSAGSPPATPSSGGGGGGADGPPYAQLIFRALMSRANRCMSLQEIYQWFRENTDKHRAGGKGWQNSIRHNLSMNRGFIKRERKEAEQNGGAVAPLIDEISGEPKRSTEWTLQDWAIEHGVQSTTRYRGTKTSRSSSRCRARRSSPGSPYPSRASSSSPYRRHRRAAAAAAAGPYNSRVASLHHHHHANAAGAMMRPPTSHYYPSAPSASSSDPYREQLMHEAMMAQGTPIKRESMPPSPPPAENGHGGYGNVMLPGYHGLLQTLEPEFPFGTQHVHVGYPPNIMPGASHDDENGCNGGDAGNSGHNMYGQQHPY